MFARKVILLSYTCILARLGDNRARKDEMWCRKCGFSLASVIMWGNLMLGSEGYLIIRDIENLVLKWLSPNYLYFFPCLTRLTTH